MQSKNKLWKKCFRKPGIVKHDSIKTYMLNMSFAKPTWTVF